MQVCIEPLVILLLVEFRSRRGDGRVVGSLILSYPLDLACRALTSRAEVGGRLERQPGLAQEANSVEKRFGLCDCPTVKPQRAASP